MRNHGFVSILNPVESALVPIEILLVLPKNMVLMEKPISGSISVISAELKPTSKCNV